MRSRTATRLRGDDGSVIVEAALVLPLIVLIASGVLEFGIIFRNRNIVGAGLRTAVRNEAQLGRNQYADFRMLTTLWANINKYKNASITKVVVYRSTSANGTISTSCKNLTPSNSGNGIAGQCNVYSAGQVQFAGLNQAQFMNSCVSGWDHWWCPSSRKDKLTDPPDYVGVYIRLSYTTVTKVLPVGALTMEDYVVARIEPSVN